MGAADVVPVLVLRDGWQPVMLVAPVERPVASAAYGFVRFLGGASAAIDSELQSEAAGQQ
jgi:hypothetical protein